MIKLPFVKINIFNKLSESSIELNFESLFINSNLLVNHYQLPVTNKNLKEVLKNLNKHDHLPNSFVKWFYQEGIVYFNNNVLEEIYEFTTEDQEEYKLLEFIDILNYISSFRMYLVNVCKLIENHVNDINDSDSSHLSNFFSSKDFILKIKQERIDSIELADKSITVLDKYFLTAFKFIRNFDVRKIHKPVNPLSLNDFFIILSDFIKELDLVILSVITTDLSSQIKISLNESSKRIIIERCSEKDLLLMKLYNIYFSDKYSKILKSFM